VNQLKEKARVPSCRCESCGLTDVGNIGFVPTGLRLSGSSDRAGFCRDALAHSPDEAPSLSGCFHLRCGKKPLGARPGASAARPAAGDGAPAAPTQGRGARPSRCRSSHGSSAANTRSWELPSPSRPSEERLPLPLGKPVALLTGFFPGRNVTVCQVNGFRQFRGLGGVFHQTWFGIGLAEVTLPFPSSVCGTGAGAAGSPGL